MPGSPGLPGRFALGAHLGADFRDSLGRFTFDFRGRHPAEWLPHCVEHSAPRRALLVNPSQALDVRGRYQSRNEHPGLRDQHARFMSYNRVDKTGINWALNAAAPMLNDIAAIQFYYGKDMTTADLCKLYGVWWERHSANGGT